MSIDTAEPAVADASPSDDVAVDSSAPVAEDVSSELLSQWDDAVDSDSSPVASTPAAPNTAPPQVDAHGGGPSPAASGASPQAPAQPQAQWTQQDFQYAQALGVSQQDLQRIGDPNVFRTMVNRVGQLMQQQAAPAPQQMQPVQYQGFQPYKLPGDENLYDEGIRGAIGHFNQHLEGVHKQYEQRFQQLAPVLNQFQQHLPYLAQMQQSAQKAAQQSFYDQFDAALDGMDESIVGRGKVSALTDPAHKQNRAMVAAQVEKEIAYHRSRGDAMPPLSEMADRAFHGLFYKQLQQQNAAVVRGRVADRMRQTTVAPSRTASRPAAGGDGLGHIQEAWGKALAGR